MKDHHSPAILFLTGASGVGKTTILKNLKKRLAGSEYIFLHYDSIGVPSVQEMIEQAGSLERWQEITTHRWIETIAEEYPEDKIVLIEGQSNLDFIDDAYQKYMIERGAIVLLDCDWETMKDRLTQNRRQPGLANQDMKNWADFLRKQAKNKSVAIIDTSEQTPEAVSEIIEKEIIPELIKEAKSDKHNL